jgi:branched-chain amino acid transport system ATP-binding protein
MNETILETQDLTKRFRGLVAVNGVTLAFARGQVHAVIGPNGAGKSTFINLLSGDQPPTGGRILFKGRDITGLPNHAIAQLGVGRSYQKTNIFPSFTCFQNCWIAAQSRLPSSMRFFRPALRHKDVRARAERALEMCGLAPRRDAVAATVSHGEQRQLEVAMMLATEPELLLLDEPLAGMGQEESARMIALLRGLARAHTLILIEHDMDAVFSIAETLTVMANGEVLETGSVAKVRASKAVQEVYLGVDGDA